MDEKAKTQNSNQKSLEGFKPLPFPPQVKTGHFGKK